MSHDRDYHGRMLPGHSMPKGEDSPRWKGGRTVDTKGYVRIKTPGHPKQDSRGYVKEHILVAEAALGKSLPRTVQIHHFDEDRTNNKNGNLVICQDGAYHSLLHARQRVKKAGGDPNSQAFCSRCKALKDFGDFGLSRHSSQNRMGRNDRCKECCKELKTLNKVGERNRAYERRHERDPLIGTRRPGSGRKRILPVAA